jgi:hypothetical protein
MRKITKKEIEKRAIMVIINYYEPQIKNVIKQSVKELEKINKVRDAQSLDPKKRINENCIKNAIKTINSKHDYYLPKKAGGKKKEKIF